MFDTRINEYIKSHLENYLRQKNIDTSKNFRCLNPEHEDKNPSMSLDRTSRSGLHCKCFSCGAYYDIFDLIAIDYGIIDKREIFEKAYEIFNFSFEDTSNTSIRCPRGLKFARNTPDGYQDTRKQFYVPRSVNLSKTNFQDRSESFEQRKINSMGRLVRVENLDLSLEIEGAHQELLKNEKALAHYQKRGLSLEIIRKYKLGYAQEGANSLLKNYPENRFRNSKSSFYKFILPYASSNNEFNYFLAEISDRGQIDEYNSKYRKISGSFESPIFNERYLKQENVPEIIFVCEGIYDALSVEESGGFAIAFSGIAHRRFLNLCEIYDPKNTVFVIALDNDKAGIQASGKIAKELDSLGILCIVRSSLNKDFNEDLVMNRDGFFEHIRKITQDALEYKKNVENIQKLEYEKDTALSFLKDFTDRISIQNSSFCPTGIKSLDEILDGGLYSGLYCIGSVSSLGKTTFCLQIADSVALNGKDVLIFSLEMSKYELIAKSISRHTMIEAKKQNLNSCFAKTTRSILSNYLNFSQKDKEIIQSSIES